jgi:hypothetical protein
MKIVGFIFMISLSLFGQNASNNDFSGNFYGKINNKNVSFHLESKAGDISGAYYYPHPNDYLKELSYKVVIKLKGKWENDMMLIDGYDYQEKPIAKMRLKFDESSLQGVWQNLSNNETFPISLQK